MTMVNPNVYPVDHSTSDVEVDIPETVDNQTGSNKVGEIALGEATTVDPVRVKRHGREAVEQAFIAAGLCDERHLLGVGAMRRSTFLTGI